MIRWKQRIERAFPLVCAGLLLLGLGGCQEKQPVIPETLSVKYGDASAQTIDYDRAVELLAQQNGMDDKIGTQKLAVLQSAVQELERLEEATAQAGGEVSYCRFSQPVSIPEVGMTGAVTALVAVADGVESAAYDSHHILLVGDPVGSMGAADFRWVHTAGSAELNGSRASARLFAEGYVEAVSAATNETPWSSGAIQIELELTADMV